MKFEMGKRKNDSNMETMQNEQAADNSSGVLPSGMPDVPVSSDETPVPNAPSLKAEETKETKESAVSMDLSKEEPPHTAMQTSLSDSIQPPLLDAKEAETSNRHRLPGQEEPAVPLAGMPDQGQSLPENKKHARQQARSLDGKSVFSKAESVLTNRKVGWGLLGLTLVFGLSTCSLAGNAQSTSNSVSRLQEERDSLQLDMASLEEQISDRDLQIQSLQDELEEIKNGPDAALREVKNAFEAGEYEKVGTLYADMHQKYNGMSQDQEAKSIADQATAKIEEQKEAERKAEEEKRKAEEEEKRRQEEEEAKGYETGITYEQLARTPDEFEGKKVKFSGKVLQVIYQDEIAMVRLAVNSDYNQVLYCVFASDLTSSRILDDDMITVYGNSNGLYSYTSVMNQSIEIPSVLVLKIDQ